MRRHLLSLSALALALALGPSARADRVTDLIDRACNSPPPRHVFATQTPTLPLHAALVARAASAPPLLRLPRGRPPHSDICRPTYAPPRWDRVSGNALLHGRAASGPPRSTPLPRWWTGTFDGVRVPQAVTADAVRYYSGLIKAFRAGDFSATGGLQMERSLLRYSATVAARRTFMLGGKVLRDVQVVTLELQWNMRCGPLCALRVAKRRVVVFRRRGARLATLCDGPATYSVS